MKKIYAFLFASLLGHFATQAQLTLTKAFNEPVVGDSESAQGYDSVGVVPKATGTGKVWNFSAFTSNNTIDASTYTTAMAIPQSSAFPGTTLVQDYGFSSVFFKSTSTQVECLGFYSPLASLNYSNSMVTANWPFSYGSTFTDVYAGSYSGGLFGGSVTATITSTASGTGTLILPGGMSFTNVLQLKASNKLFETLTSPAPGTQTTTNVEYTYFHASQKFPLLSVSYEITNDGSSLDTSVSIMVNNAVITGLSSQNFDASFVIFPNPARDNFSVNLSNAANARCTMEIYDATGRLVKQLNLGNATQIKETVNLTDLGQGIYLVKTRLGEAASVRRLVVE